MHAFLNKGLAVQGRTEEVLRHGSTTARGRGQQQRSGASEQSAPAYICEALHNTIVPAAAWVAAAWVVMVARSCLGTSANASMDIATGGGRQPLTTEIYLCPRSPSTTDST
jgi:hypothetical protein